jgi:small-conductance mechanosensitive channel
MHDAALAAAWFTLAVLSGVGACLFLSLALDGMRSAWGLMAALMGAATLAVWMGAQELAAIMLAHGAGGG